MSPTERQLVARVDAVRAHLERRALIATTLFGVAAVAGVLILAWLLVGGDGWRAGSNVPALLDLALVGFLGALAFVARRRANQAFDEAPLSAAIESAAGVERGVVRGTLELARSRPRGVSGALAEVAVAGTTERLAGRTEPELAGSIGQRVTEWSRRGLGVAGALAFLLVALTAASPERTRNALSGIISPLATAADPVLPPLGVQPGDIEVQRGADVQLDISAAGRTRVLVSWQAAGDVARSDWVEVREGQAGYTFRTVAANIEYGISDEVGGATERFTIRPVDPLFVSDLVVSVTYPPHTGLPADEYRGDPPPLRLPAGSTLLIEGSASRPLTSVALVDTAGSPAVDFSVEENTFTARWTPPRGADLAWAFRDAQGNPAEIQPEPLEITVVADAPPVIAIPLPGRDTIMPLNLRQPLIIEAGDEYGLRRVELVAYRVTSFGERMEPVSQGFDVGGQRAILARPLLNLTGWGLLPGDTVRYFARAIDNHPSGQVSTSPEYVLRLPEAAELRREAEDALEDVADRLRELAAEAEREAEENRDQALEDATPRGIPQEGEEEDFEQRQELEAALEQQQQMSAEVDSLRAEMEALEQMMEEAAQADPELRSQLEELQELLQEATGSELQQRMEEMAEALEQNDLEQANQSLEEMAAEQENFRERLEQAIEQFQRAALEQDFRATTSEAEELARQEQALADAMEAEDQPELRAQQQAELEQQAEALETRMEELQERLFEMGEMEAAEGVREAQQSASEARQDMQQAMQQAQQGQTAQAGQEAQEAAAAMDEAAREMQEAMAEMAQEQMEAQQEALLRTADDALSLARRQGELREEMRGASQEQLAQMRAQEASLLAGVQNMAENLQIATEGAMGANRELSAQMGLAMESLQNTIEAMETRRGASSPAAQAEQVIGDLNQLALMAIAGAEQMGQQQSQGASGEDVAEQLEQLAQQQGELMNQSSQMMPMQLPQEAMSQQMQQMQSGQESVASDLGDLADEPGSEESLGDLQQLAQEAQAIAEEMAQGRLTPEVVQRQERLFHRLLDAGRSLEREEFSEERESEEPGEFERGDVLGLTADQMGVIRFEIPDGEQLQRLSPAVRQLVLQYFERLNRAPPPGGGS